MALLGPREKSDLSPHSGPKRTLIRLDRHERPSYRGRPRRIACVAALLVVGARDVLLVVGAWLGGADGENRYLTSDRCPVVLRRLCTYREGPRDRHILFLFER